MAQQTINVGAAPNDGTGDPARTAFTKSNDNFTELYARSSLTAPQGRLTLQTATPVMTTTQSAKTTIFYTPYVGNQVPIYNGTTMSMTTFAELSNVTTASSTGSAGPAAVAASSVYDLFVWSNSGTVTLTRGPAWTSDTARSAGTVLTMVNGILLNNAAITNGPAASRGTYVGTVRSNGSSQLDFIYGASGSPPARARFAVWNAYNRVMVGNMFCDTTASWTYASTTVRQVNGAAHSENQVSFVSGLDEDTPFMLTQSVCTNNADGAAQVIGIGIDTATAIAGIAGQGSSGGGTNTHAVATLATRSFGFHSWSALEAGTTASTITFLGGTATAPARNRQGQVFQFLM